MERNWGHLLLTSGHYVHVCQMRRHVCAKHMLTRWFSKEGIFSLFLVNFLTLVRLSEPPTWHYTLLSSGTRIPIEFKQEQWNTSLYQRQYWEQFCVVCLMFFNLEKRKFFKGKNTSFSCRIGDLVKALPRRSWSRKASWTTMLLSCHRDVWRSQTWPRTHTTHHRHPEGSSRRKLLATQAWHRWDCSSAVQPWRLVGILPSLICVHLGFYWR